MIKVLSVFGTRPEAIKMAPVIKALERRSSEFDTIVCLSAQHREMLDQVMETFGLTADYDLNLMTKSQSPAQVTARVLECLPPLLNVVQPDVLLVQGDTMTTFAAALAAHIAMIPVGHVEAGLRTGNRYQPFPEEMNRVLTSRLTTLHFAPTERARLSLLAEGVSSADVLVTGNTVIDALLQTIRSNYTFQNSSLNELDSTHRMVLVTAHRRESFGEPLKDICGAIAELAKNIPNSDFVFPVHMNPEVKHTAEKYLNSQPNICLIEPVEYLEFVHLMARAYLVLTDSGGIQEEAPSLGKPVLVMRKVTERPEGVEAGNAALVGTDTASIVAAVTELFSDESKYERMAKAVNPYGDGRASERILNALVERLG
jgi:UDP-N-acetylglucosamine 2-epimerase (non-hydrolysing)